MTAIDLTALTRSSTQGVTLASGIVSQSGTGTDYTGWSDVSSIYLAAKCTLRDGSRGFARIVMTVEESADGNSWTPLQAFTFGAGGSGAEQTATVTPSEDHIRASWATTGRGEWQIVYVTATPSIINDPGGGGSVPYVSGSGSPVGAVTPTSGKPLYIDTDNGCLYLATGATDTDWVVFGEDANGIGGTAGFPFIPGSGLGVLAGSPDTPFNGYAYFSDAYALWNGHSDSLRWVGNGTDGEQQLQVVTGGGTFTGTLQDGDGNMTVPGTISCTPLMGVYEQDGMHTNINDGEDEDLPFALASGDAVLDVTDADAPLFVLAGTYAVTARVVADVNLTADGYALATVNVGGNPEIKNTLERSDGVMLSGTVVVAANAPLFVRVANFDGVTNRGFSLEFAQIVKLA